MPKQKKNWDKEWEVPEDEQGQTYDDGNLFGPDTDDPPPVKKLKRDMEWEALTRLEEAARTEADFREVVKTWDRLDANRERRERYHEILIGDFGHTGCSDDPQLETANQSLRIPCISSAHGNASP